MRANLMTHTAIVFAAVLCTVTLGPGVWGENAKEDCTDKTCRRDSSPVKLRLGLEWFTNPYHLPLIIAKREGFFASFGLDVELVEPSDHWEAEKEIIEGRLDVAVTEPLHLAQDACAGKPILGFSRFLHTDCGVMYLKKSGITRPRDMCGKTITYPGSPGKGGPAIVNTMVKADGGECALQSYGKHNGGFFHTDALASGAADLATLIFWNFEIPEARSKGMDAGFFSLKEWGVPDFCQLVLFTTHERFTELKPALRLLVLAIRKATGYIHQNPEAAREHYRAHVGKNADESVMEATLTATLPAFPNDNSMASEYFDRLMQWLVDTEQVRSEEANKTPVTAYWSNEIAW